MQDSALEIPRIQHRIRMSFDNQGLMHTLGATLTTIEPGFVEIAYKARPELSQQHGFMHAGVATAIVDSACGYAALSLAETGREVLTAEFKINFLRPARFNNFLARGRVLKPGRLLSVCEGEVLGVDDGQEVLIAKMQATMTLVESQPE